MNKIDTSVLALMTAFLLSKDLKNKSGKVIVKNAKTKKEFVFNTQKEQGQMIIKPNNTSIYYKLKRSPYGSWQLISQGNTPILDINYKKKEWLAIEVGTGNIFTANEMNKDILLNNAITNQLIPVSINK